MKELLLEGQKSTSSRIGQRRLQVNINRNPFGVSSGNQSNVTTADLIQEKTSSVFTAHALDDSQSNSRRAVSIKKFKNFIKRKD